MFLVCFSNKISQILQLYTIEEIKRMYRTTIARQQRLGLQHNGPN